MDIPKYSTSLESPCSGAMSSSYNNSATARGGYYGEMGGASRYLNSNGRGSEGDGAHRYRYQGHQRNEASSGGSGDRSKPPQKYEVSDDMYYDHHEKRDHSTYHCSAMPVAQHLYDDHHQQYHHDHDGYKNPVPRYDHQQGAGLNQPVERYSYQSSHRTTNSMARPSEYNLANHQEDYHQPARSQYYSKPAEMHSHENGVPALAESDTSDHYIDTSDHYKHHEDSYNTKQPAKGSGVQKAPPLLEKLAGVKTVEVAPGVHLRLRGTLHVEFIALFSSC